MTSLNDSCCALEESVKHDDDASKHQFPEAGEKSCSHPSIPSNAISLFASQARESQTIQFSKAASSVLADMDASEVEQNQTNPVSPLSAESYHDVEEKLIHVPVNTSFITGELSLNAQFMMSPQSTFDKLFAGNLGLSDKTVPADINEHPTAQRVNNLDEYEQQQSSNDLPRSLDTENAHNNESNNTFPSRQNLGENILEADSESSNSDSSNEYQTRVAVENIDGIVKYLQSLLDTQCRHNLISRSALNRVGRVKEHPLPSAKVVEIWNLLNPNDRRVPKYFVCLPLWIIGKRFEVDLRIMEGVNGFDIVLGRRFIRKNGGNSLLEEITNRRIHNADSILTNDSFGGFLIEGKTSKKQKADERVKKEKGRQRARQAKADLTQMMQNWQPLSSGASSQTQYTGTSIGRGMNGHWASPLAGPNTDWGSPAIQQPQRYAVGPYYRPPISQPIIQNGNFRSPQYVPAGPPQRMDSGSSGSTQNTGFSFGSRQGTASSMSSWANTAIYQPKDRGLTKDLLGQEDNE